MGSPGGPLGRCVFEERKTITVNTWRDRVFLTGERRRSVVVHATIGNGTPAQVRA